GGRLQDLVRPAQFPILFLEVLDPLGISGGGAGSVAGIDLILVNPGPQGFGVDSELVADTAEDAAAGTRVGFESVADHADCSFTKLEGVLLLGHDREGLSVASLSLLCPGRVSLCEPYLSGAGEVSTSEYLTNDGSRSGTGEDVHRRADDSVKRVGTGPSSRNGQREQFDNTSFKLASHRCHAMLKSRSGDYIAYEVIDIVGER